MVGDDVMNDVGGAQRCGLTGILVRTGKYRYVCLYYLCILYSLNCSSSLSDYSPR